MDAPLEVDLDRVAASIEASFALPRPVRPLSVLGRGFRSMAVETARGHVFLVGLSSDASDGYAKAWRAGRFLAGRLGRLPPRPRWLAEPSAAFPHGALGYRKRPGETPAWGADAGPAFARDLGRFMARLHGLPIREARAAGLPEVDSHARMAGAWRVVKGVLAAQLDSEAFARLDAWWLGFAADERMRPRGLAVCHHDLWHDNLLRSRSGRLSGVLDLAHVEVGDAAHDFAAPRHFGDPFWADLVRAYRAAGGVFDLDHEYRALRFWEAREFGGLAWAIEHSDQSEVDNAIRKVLRSPLLAARLARYGL